MRNIKHFSLAIVLASSLLLATPVWTAQSVPMGTIIGTWELKFENGMKGTLVVDKSKATIDISSFFKGEGSTGDRGEYVEFFMSEKNSKRLFVFGYIKGGILEGTIQDQVPCEEIKKDFGNLVKTTNTSCQVAFKGNKK
jgi:hypothetical protein